VHLYNTIIQFDHTIAKLCFTETGMRFNHINHFTINFKYGINIIQVAISPAPEI